MLEEKIKSVILDKKIQIVCFDIFDTLITRPFSKPSDLFKMLDEPFSKIVGTDAIYNFSTMRVMAEKRAKEKLPKDREEVSLEEIYTELQKSFNITNSICNKMKKLEIDAEVKYCVANEPLKKLFNLAKNSGKQIVLISDMYLDESIINKIMLKNGYKGYKLYLSSTVGKCKSTGKLYRFVIKDLNVKNKDLRSIIHIGDNYNSDFKKAKKNGIRAFCTHSLLDNSQMIKDFICSKNKFLQYQNKRVKQEFPCENNNQRKKKVLLYSHELSFSGAPKSLLRICKVLIKNGYEVEVWSLYDGPLKKNYNELGVKVVICDFYNADYYYAMKTFDMCIVNTAFSYKFYYMIKNFIPTIWYIREATNLKDMFEVYGGLKEIFEKSTDIVCVSEYARDIIVKKSYNSSVEIIRNCIEDEYDGDKKKFDKNNVVFASLGTIEPRKGYDILYKAFKLLPKTYKKRVKFRIAGRKMDFCKYWAEDIIRKFNKSKNFEFFYEIVDKKKLKDFYKTTDVILVPSRDESCSLVAIEGAMNAKPLIVTKNVGAQYLVKNEENGYIVKTSSPRDLAKVIKKILDKSADEIEKMGDVSRKIYEENASMKSYEKTIIDMIQKKILTSEKKEFKLSVGEVFDSKDFDFKLLLNSTISNRSNSLKKALREFNGIRKQQGLKIALILLFRKIKKKLRLNKKI